MNIVRPKQKPINQSINFLKLATAIRDRIDYTTSLSQVCNEIDVGYYTVSKLLANKTTEAMQVGTLIKICNWLGRSVADFIDIKA